LIDKKQIIHCDAKKEIILSLLRRMDSQEKSKLANLINEYIHQELNNFVKNYRNPQITKKQELRSLSIAWFSSFFPDHVSFNNSEMIHTFVETALCERDYDSFGWIRIPALEASSYKLTGDINHLHSMLNKLSCEQSRFRDLMMISAAFVVQSINFNNEILNNATMTNINRRQFYHQENIILRLCTEGDANDKKRWLYQLMNDNDYLADFIKELLKGALIHNNDFFFRQFSEIKTYVLFSLLDFINSYRSNVPQAHNNEIRTFSMKLRNYEEKHPLTNTSIDFSYLR